MFLLDVASLKASVIGMYYVFRDYSEAFKKPKMNYPEEFVPLAECVIEDITVYIEHRGALLLALLAQSALRWKGASLSYLSKPRQAFAHERRLSSRRGLGPQHVVSRVPISATADVRLWFVFIARLTSSFFFF